MPKNETRNKKMPTARIPKPVNFIYQNRQVPPTTGGAVIIPTWLAYPARDISTIEIII